MSVLRPGSTVVYVDLSGREWHGVVDVFTRDGTAAVVDFSGESEVVVAHDSLGREVWDGDALVIHVDKLGPR